MSTSTEAHKLCPKCDNNIPFLESGVDDYYYIAITCPCKYKEKMPIKEYVNFYRSNKDKKVAYSNKCPVHNEIFDGYYTNDYDEIVQKCSKCEIDSKYRVYPIIEDWILERFERLKKEAVNVEKHRDYMKSLKDKYSKEFASSKELEEAFNTCIERINDTLCFLNIIIDNFRKDNYNLAQLIRQKPSINNYYEPIIGDNVTKSLINYFSLYNLYKIKPIHILDQFNNREKDHSFFLLQDKRLATFSDKNTVGIIDPENDYKTDLVIEGFSEEVISICQLENGDLAISYGKHMKIISLEKNKYSLSFTIENAHDEVIKKVVTLSKNRFASCSFDQTIKIWKGDKEYSATPIKVLEGHTAEVLSLLYLKNRDLLISSSKDFTVRVWNLDTYQNTQSIIGAKNMEENTLFQYDESGIIVGSGNKFYIVNIDEGKIEDKVLFNDQYPHPLTGITLLRDNKTLFLIKNAESEIRLYNVETKKMTKITFEDCTCPIEVLSYDNETILIHTYPDIKTWKY